VSADIDLHQQNILPQRGQATLVGNGLANEGGVASLCLPFWGNQWARDAGNDDRGPFLEAILWQFESV
jgi:hypothetical protein